MDVIELAEKISAPFSVPALMLNLGVGLIAALLIGWHFRRFGRTLSNRSEFALVFPFILLTTLLIITIVKSSIALSLGLVGALSIVRFRTPIKEPEELAYLFFTIAVGLGLGAGYTLETSGAALVILVAVAIARWTQRTQNHKRVYLSIEQGASPVALVALTEALTPHAKSLDLRRHSVFEGGQESTFVIEVEDDDKLDKLSTGLVELCPNAAVTFFDQRQMPGS